MAMGWWVTSATGGIALPGAAQRENAAERVEWWGDAPADELAAAVRVIEEMFVAAFRRRPFKSELEHGMRFLLGGYEEG
jgi:hypothetical protein